MNKLLIKQQKGLKLNFGYCHKLIIVPSYLVINESNTPTPF